MTEERCPNNAHGGGHSWSQGWQNGEYGHKCANGCGAFKKG